VSEPLTAEEEAALRERHWILPSRGGSDDIARLLATLDATRKLADEGLAGGGLDVEAAVNTLRRGGIGERQARHLAVVALAAALTGERHDLDDEYLTADQRHRLAALAKETP